MTPVHDDACGTATSGTSTGDAAVRRTVESGQGWIAGGGPPEGAAPLVDRISAAWRDAGREGEPRFAALAYFGLGDEAASGAALRSYYGFAGDYAEAIAASALRTPQGVKDALRRSGTWVSPRSSSCPPWRRSTRWTGSRTPCSLRDPARCGLNNTAEVCPPVRTLLGQPMSDGAREASPEPRRNPAVLTLCSD